MINITKDTIIGDILDVAPQTAPIFLSIGMHCLGCPSSRGETVEEACMVHGVDCDKLLALGPKQVVITSVPCDEDHLKIVSYEANQLFPEAYEVKKLPFATCGTGDVFTSTLLGYVLNGKDLNRCVQEAADFVSYVIDTTIKAGTDPKEGVVLEGCLWKLLFPQSKNCTTCMA